jgi:EAL domain-containing protein (putative c-di-GMP-specific phosphodiesterase class I)
MDDFGTGYSSLGYLRRFPVDILKIARDFVVEPDLEQSEWAFAHAIVALGQTLGLHIIAEGIEEAAQVDRLLQLGCEFGQGFHLGPPVDAGAPAAVRGREPVTAIRPASRPTSEWVAKAAG